MPYQLRVPSEQALSLFTPRILTQWEAGKGVLGSRWGETRRDCGVSPQVRGRVLTPHGPSQPLGNLCVPCSAPACSRPQQEPKPHSPRSLFRSASSPMSAQPIVSCDSGLTLVTSLVAIRTALLWDLDPSLVSSQVCPLGQVTVPSGCHCVRR